MYIYLCTRTHSDAHTGGEKGLQVSVIKIFLFQGQSQWRSETYWSHVIHIDSSKVQHWKKTTKKKNRIIIKGEVGIFADF